MTKLNVLETNIIGIAPPDPIDLVELFCEALERHAHHKRELYDGFNSKLDVASRVMMMTEELGEIASEVIRQRPAAAVAECIDLAHCCMLLAMKLDPDGTLIKRTS